MNWMTLAQISAVGAFLVFVGHFFFP